MKKLAHSCLTLILLQLITSLFKAMSCLCVYFDKLVRSDRVEVSLHGHSLVRCTLPVETWELLWELRTSIQTMLYRNLKDPKNAITNAAQDGKLISVLVELLNNTDPNPSAENHGDGEVD